MTSKETSKNVANQNTNPNPPTLWLDNPNTSSDYYLCGNDDGTYSIKYGSTEGTALTKINIAGLSVDVPSKLRVGNGLSPATSTTPDLQITTINSSQSIQSYCNGPSGKSYIQNGCSGGGFINLVSTSGGAQYGIPTFCSGISSLYSDMVFATGSTGLTASEKMRLKNDGSGLSFTASLGTEKLTNSNYATDFTLTSTGGATISATSATQIKAITTTTSGTANIAQSFMTVLPFGKYLLSFNISSLSGSVPTYTVSGICSSVSSTVSIGVTTTTELNVVNGGSINITFKIATYTQFFISDISLKPYTNDAIQLGEVKTPSNSICNNFTLNGDGTTYAHTIIPMFNTTSIGITDNPYNIIYTNTVSSPNNLFITTTTNGNTITIGGGTMEYNTKIILNSSVNPFTSSIIQLGSDTYKFLDFYTSGIHTNNLTKNANASYISVNNDLRMELSNILCSVSSCNIGSSSTPFGTIYGSNVNTPAISYNGTIVLSANATPTEYIRLSQISTTNYIQCSADIIPKPSMTASLGTTADRWSNLWASAGTISNLTTGSIYNTTSMQIGTGNRLQLNATTNIEVTSKILPNTNGTLDIGSSTYKFGNMYATAFLTSSDKRLKTNIRPLNRGLEFINKIEPIEFNYTSNLTKDVYGFIAQDVEKVLDDENQSLIRKPEEQDGFYSIEYSQFVPIVIKSIQDLYNIVKSGAVENRATDIPENKSYVDEIEILKNSIELLTSEINKLKKEIKKLQK